jgi:predicted exporter
LTVTLELAGVGVISTELEQTIRQEAQQRSIVAGIALTLLLWLAYRRWSLLLLAAVPLLSGALFGLAAVALLFGRVHGITLAFGFTLLGVAIDYPLHVFSHSRRRPAGIAIRAIWPTLRLGVLSTVAAYIALAVSGSSGLSQLGVFTSTGLITAALVTRYLLPPLLSRRVVMPIAGADHPPAGSLSIRLRGWPPALAVLLVLLVLIGLAAATGLRRPLWDNDLASLSPVAKTRATREGELRAILGTPDLRHVIAIRAANLEQALQASEQLDRQLAEAAASGWLSDWQVITRLLPSAASQQRRRAALPSVPQLHAEIEQSIAATPFVADAFAPFEQAVAASRELPLLDLEKIRASEFAAFADSHLYQTPDSWVSIISLYHLQQPGQLQNWLKQYPQAQLVDFKQAANDLVADYRSRLLEILLGAGVIVMILLLWRLQMRRAVWCMATVGSAVLTTAGIVYAAGGPLNLYHLVALLLVFGLGLDYALFASDEYQAREEYRDTLHAILSCAASTFIVFAILGFSAIPALHALGGTIAVGTALCLLLALTGVRRIAA